MKKLFVIYGGPGREKEVSVSSGRNIAETLHAQGYPCEAIYIYPDFVWEYNEEILSREEGLALLKKENALVFQVLHGTYGEDGVFVRHVEEQGIPYIGSSSVVMKMTIDKKKTEDVLREHGISTPTSYAITSLSEIGDDISLPAIVKPKNEGSSIALSKVHTKAELARVLKRTLPEYGSMLVENFVEGREFTCGVVEIDGNITALLPTEIILTEGDLFDYEAKYTVGGCKEVTPADIDEELTNRIQELAKRVHILCGCKDISRTDMILDKERNLVVLEINTVPGMTRTSFIPAQLEASGYTLSQFVEGMLEKYSK